MEGTVTDVASTGIQTVGDVATNTPLISPTAPVPEPSQLVTNQVAPAAQATANSAPSLGSGVTATPAEGLMNPAKGITGATPTDYSAISPKTLSNAPVSGGTYTPTSTTVNIPGAGGVQPTGWLDKIIASPTASMLGVQAIGSTASAFGGYLTAKDQQKREDALRAQQTYNMNAASRIYGRG
jgi:hypothetical protein